MNFLMSTPSCTHSAQEESPEVIPFANQLSCNMVTHHVHLIQQCSLREL